MPLNMLDYAARLGRKQAQASATRILEALSPLVDAVIDPEESLRRASVQHVLSTCVPAVVDRLIDRLVELLASGGESLRRRAADSLVQFGVHALPAVTEKFRNARNAETQRCLLEVLGKIGQILRNRC